MPPLSLEKMLLWIAIVFCLFYRSQVRRFVALICLDVYESFRPIIEAPPAVRQGFVLMTLLSLALMLTNWLSKKRGK